MGGFILGSLSLGVPLGGDNKMKRKEKKGRKKKKKKKKKYRWVKDGIWCWRLPEPYSSGSLLRRCPSLSVLLTNSTFEGKHNITISEEHKSASAQEQHNTISQYHKHTGAQYHNITKRTISQ